MTSRRWASWLTPRFSTSPMTKNYPDSISRVRIAEVPRDAEIAESNATRRRAGHRSGEVSWSSG